MADKDVKKEPEDHLNLKHDMDGATDMIRGRE